MHGAWSAWLLNEYAGQQLIEQKQGELNQWREHAESLHAEIESKAEKNSNMEEKVLKVKSRTDFYKILAQEMGEAKSEIIGLTTLDVHHHLLHNKIFHIDLLP